MKKAWSTAVALLLVLSLIVGCTQGNGNGSNGGTSNDAADNGNEQQEPVTLKVFRPANIVDPEKDPVLMEIQKRLNIKLEIVTAP